MLPGNEPVSEKVPELMKMVENHPSFKEALDGLLWGSGKNDAYVEALDKSDNVEDKQKFAGMIRRYAELTKLCSSVPHTGVAGFGREEVVKKVKEYEREMFALRDKTSELLEAY